MRLTRAGFLRYATYRQAVFAGLVTNTVFGFLRTAIVLTVFAGSARVAGYDPASAVTFVWVGQGLLAVAMIFGEGELAGRVRTGQVGTDLLRPVDLQAALLAEDVGRAGFAMLTRFTVPMLIGGLAFTLALPTSPVRWLSFAVGVLLAVLVSFGLRFLINLTAFWLLLRAVHRVPPAVFAQRLERHVELLDMAGFLRVPVRQLSLGQRMRGEVTAALLHDPELVVLDEPTIELDLTSKERLRGFLAGVNAERGVTLLLTTHDLPDVERLCRRLVVIDQGRVLVDGDLDALRRRFGGARQLVVELVEPSAALDGLPGVLGVTVEAAGLRQRLAVRDLTVAEPSIEDLVRTLYAS